MCQVISIAQRVDIELKISQYLVIFVGQTIIHHDRTNDRKPNWDCLTLPTLDEIHKRAESGDTSAQTELGRIYFNGEGVTRDRIKGVALYEKASKQGDKEARRELPDVYFKLGIAFYKGTALPQNPLKGMDLCEKAAVMGHRNARTIVSEYYYRKGKKIWESGVGKKLKNAMSYFEKAAEMGHGDTSGPLSNVYHQLGMQYYNGDRAIRDVERAITYFEKAARIGNNESRLILGDIYLDGNVVVQNIQNACTWYQTAADHGSVQALITLGDMYFKGYGVTKDHKKAACVMATAAKLGSADAQDFMGLAYERGYGVLKNYKRALHWYNMAVENGSPWATEGKNRCLKSIEKAKKTRLSTLNDIQNCFKNNFVASDVYYADKNRSRIIPSAEYKREKIAFVRNWVKSNCNGISINDDQAEAIATVNGHVQVVARAGSGKTSVLVNRAYFLIKHCNVSPGSILILAFNRKAVEEIRERMKELLLPSKSKSLEVEFPHVLTFHALARSIVHPTEELIYDSEDQPKISREISDIVLELIESTDWEYRIRNLLLDFFRDDWDKIIRSGHGKNKAGFIRELRSLYTSETLGGEFVKSSGEKAIANFLFEHDVEYKYEKPYQWNGSIYRPDFTLGGQEKVIIEYFGLLGNSEYDEEAARKREYWYRQRNYLFIELNPQQIKSGDYQRILKQNLSNKGIPCVKLAEEVIWRKIKDHAIGRFTKAVSVFVARCRKEVLAPDDVNSKIEGHSYFHDDVSGIEKRFYEISLVIFGKYLGILKLRNKEDFNGLIQRAVKHISDGHTLFHRRKTGSGDLSALVHILVDEFQDFSRLFFDMLKAVESKNTNFELFCVGDDWQAINRFAGSDLRYFSDFKRYFGTFTRIVLSTNYRSGISVVEIGNRLMMDKGKPATAHSLESGKVEVADLESLNEYQAHNLVETHTLDPAYSLVRRLIAKSVNLGQNTVILCRTNRIGYPTVELKDYIAKLTDNIPKDRRSLITISTTHSYKGMENDAVIVFTDEYPILHPHWVFGRLFGDSESTLLDDEQRLFYVAMSRAKHTLFLVTGTHERRGFINEIRTGLDQVNWDEYRIPEEESSYKVVVTGTTAKTSSALQLRKSGYTYNAISTKGPCWYKQSGDFGDVLLEPWIQTGQSLTKIGALNSISIQFLDYENRRVHEVQIADGQVRRIR